MSMPAPANLDVSAYMTRFTRGAQSRSGTIAAGGVPLHRVEESDQFHVVARSTVHELVTPNQSSAAEKPRHGQQSVPWEVCADEICVSYKAA
jgi:hypothetical protein